MKKIKVGILILLSIIFLIEIGLRVFAHKKLRRFKTPDYIEDTIIGYRYTPNKEDYIINAAYKNKYKINSDGFNCDEFAVKKKPGVYRIILIGMSDEVGIATNGPNNYARVLQKKFKENGDKIELMNFSIDGIWRMATNLEHAKRSAFKYKPNLILFRYVLPIKNVGNFRNSYKGYSIKYYDHNESLEKTKRYIDEKVIPHSIISVSYDVSYIFRYICKFYIEKPNNSLTKFIQKYILKKRLYIQSYVRRILINSQNYKGPHTQNIYNIDQSINLYEEARDSLASNKTEIVLFDTYLFDNKEKTSIFESSNINYLSLNLKFRPEYSFGEVDNHSSQKGHQAIAQAFYKMLFIKGIIPQKYFSNKAIPQMQVDKNKDAKNE